MVKNFFDYLAGSLALGDLGLGDADLAGLLNNDVLADGAVAGLSLQGLDDLRGQRSLIVGTI